MQGPGWLNAGSISMEAFSSVIGWMDSLGQAFYDSNGHLISPPPNATTAKLGVDLSGSILINPGARLDLSGGGRIDQQGKFNLSGKGRQPVAEKRCGVLQRL